MSSTLSGEEVGKLARALARAAPEPHVVSASDLEATVAEMARRARTAWPDLRVDLAAFFTHVGTHWPDGGTRTAATVAAGLAGLEVEDLYLAFACTQDDTRALRAFERELEGELRAAFAKLRIEPARRDDARQQLWEKLFVGAPRPRILDYSGRSRLKFWFRVTVLRALLDDVRSQKRSRERPDEDLLLGAASSEPNPEIEHLKTPVPQAVQHRVRGSGERAAPRGPQRAALLVRAEDDDRRDRGGVRHPPRHRGTPGQQRARQPAG